MTTTLSVARRAVQRLYATAKNNAGIISATKKRAVRMGERPARG